MVPLVSDQANGITIGASSGSRKFTTAWQAMASATTEFNLMRRLLLGDAPAPRSLDSNRMTDGNAQILERIHHQIVPAHQLKQTIARLGQVAGDLRKFLDRQAALGEALRRALHLPRVEQDAPHAEALGPCDQRRLDGELVINRIERSSA